MIRTLCILLFITVGRMIAAQPIPATPATLQSSRVKSVDQYFESLAQNQQFNGNVLLADRGKVVYEKSFGLADFTNGRKNSAQSSFAIASITKTITATAILQLKETGKLRLSDPVANHLPTFPYPSVTIRHLLSHTSGMPTVDSLFFALIARHPDTVFTNRNIIPACLLTKAPLIFQPGTAFSYNNLNYNILALLVEKVSTLSFEVYLTKHIFKPAGMTHTTSSNFYTSNDKHLSKRYRLKYLYSGSVEEPDTAAEFLIMRNFNFKGHGELISTARDLFRYDQALRKGKLLKQETMQEAFTPVKLTNGSDNAQHYGLGWITSHDATLGQLVKHDGGLPGGRSILLINRTKPQTVILFDNVTNNVVPIANDALKLLNGIPVATPKKSLARFYGQALAKGNLETAQEGLSSMVKDTLHYYANEDELNSLGYAFISTKQNEAALAAFKLNTVLFPQSWNVYDSYGEILLHTGNKAEALKMYQKSVALNPENENGRQVLKTLSTLK